VGAVCERYEFGITTKITVSLPDELVAQARRAVERGQAPSVSAYVAGAMRRAQLSESLDEVLDSWDAELGPPDRRARKWAEGQLRRLDG
jgi:Arc/MetJ-type ribon-helix-helix transcriptional regulator